MIRRVALLAALIVLAVISGVGAGILLAGWTESDWPTLDEDDDDAPTGIG